MQNSLKFCFRILTILILVNLSLNGYTQSNKKQNLQKEYNTILLDIKKLQTKIESRRQEQNASIKELEIISTKIEKRTKLISNIEVQKKEVENEIIDKIENAKTLNTEVEKLINDYTKLIQWLNKNHNSVNKLAFVMESKNFKEAYYRISYIKKYGDYRAKQSNIIQNQIERIMERINSLKLVKKEKANLIQANKYQQKVLITDKQERDELVEKLGVELTDLNKKVALKNKQASIVNAKIKRIIQEEIKKQQLAFNAEMKAKRQKENSSSKIPSRYKKETTATQNLPTAIEIANSPNGLLSSSFLSTKGRMPWPVSSGAIISRFGKQPHHDDPNIFIENNGIDIKTANNADVKAVYKGKVVRIFNMPMYNTCIMVKHGDYFTVYSYLKAATAKVGFEINAGDIIGKSGLSDMHGCHIVNLQIWHYQDKQNPESWLAHR